MGEGIIWSYNPCKLKTKPDTYSFFSSRKNERRYFCIPFGNSVLPMIFLSSVQLNQDNLKSYNSHFEVYFQTILLCNAIIWLAMINQSISKYFKNNIITKLGKWTLITYFVSFQIPWMFTNLNMWVYRNTCFWPWWWHILVTQRIQTQ